MSRAGFIVAFCLLPLASAAAEIRLFGPAKTSLATLAVPVGVRATAMSEAATAVGGDASSLYWNPAGLARIENFELGLAHNEWSSSLGVRQEFVSYVQNMGKGAGLGVALNYFSLGKLAGRAGDGTPSGESSPFAFGSSAGYGWSMFGDNRLKLGLAGEFALESIFSTLQTGFGASGGLIYQLNENFSAGLSANHLARGGGQFSPPGSGNFGLASYFLDRGLLFAVDFCMPFNSDAMLKAGMEMDFGILQLRGGYRHALNAPEGDVQSGMSAGAGFKVGLFSLDYAFVPYGEILSTHRLAATLHLPADFFRPKNISAEASTSTAKTYFEQAVVFEKEGKPIEAMVQYQMAENAYPEAMMADPQQFFISAKNRVREIQLEMEKKGGNSAELTAYIRLHSGHAREDINAGKFKEAMSEVVRVEAFDKLSDVIVQLRKEAEAGLGVQVAELRAAARAADHSNHLAAAIDAYIKIQGMDSKDSEAAAFFKYRRTEIRALIKDFHRKGIDLYVNGQVEEAIRLWKRGKSIDIDKGSLVDFDRDLQRATSRSESVKQ